MSLDDVFKVKELELKTLGTTLGDDMLKDLVLNPMLRGYIEITKIIIDAPAAQDDVIRLYLTSLVPSSGFNPYFFVK